MTRAEELKIELEAVESKIAAHPFSSKEVMAANRVIESVTPTDKDKIGEELLASNLPSLEQMGRITLRGLFQWGRLHRHQKKLQQKISKLQREP